MRKLFLCAIPIFAMLGTAVAVEPTAAPTHVLVSPIDVKWGAPPPVFEKGAQFAVLSGDPSKAGIFVARLKVPAGYKIAPHWHATDEHVTVISGRFALGMGEKFDKAAMTVLPAGGYALLPADMRHFAMAKTAVTVQVESMGPFTLTYINPNDDPSKRGQQK
ncbi:MAG: cupin domain-containing protein [Aquirhabdus sp.]